MPVIPRSVFEALLNPVETASSKLRGEDATISVILATVASFFMLQDSLIISF
jgi:hypothetical protein